MFPWVYDFRWTAGHVIFLCVFFSVVIVIGTTVLAALLRTIRDVRRRSTDAIAWHTDFNDLPLAARACRHELAGDVKRRTCPNGFDCRACTTHPQLLARRTTSTNHLPSEESVAGLAMPLDRMYHRGHTWVRTEEDGTWTVGLDDFASRLTGPPDRIEMPAVGDRVVSNGKGWTMRRGDHRVRILSPVDGTIVARGGTAQGWYLKVRPDQGNTSLEHLLRGEEIRPWLMREMERLQFALAADGSALNLADGGELVGDVSRQIPGVDWESVWGELFLEA